jgi:hypothetical protein
MFFAGSCCGGKNKKATITSPPPPPSSCCKPLQPANSEASNETTHSATINTHSAAQKTTFLQAIRTHIAKWFRQFFSILSIDLKALLFGKDDPNPKNA